ncbi:MAG TPA: hypothetical protein VKE95_04990 [Burkholderiales bacterium]|nr:hypothetical protein [Burkholderiales bacterium]
MPRAARTSPYQPPSARLAAEEPRQLPTAVYVLAALAVPLALWYLALDGRKWFEPALPEFVITGETWVTRALFGIPKLGVVVGLISLLTFRRYAGLIYLVCWLLALGHTAMYYRGFQAPIAGEIEWLRLAVHHVIPHVFYAYMVLSLLRFEWRRAPRTKSDISGL